MDEAPERDPDRPEPFELIGYGPLRFPFTRREMVPAAVEWYRARSLAEDRPALPLGALGMMPDEELAEITPAVTSGCEISVRDDAVWARPPGSSASIRLLATTRAGLCAFNAMNGATTLGEIAAAVADDTGWPHDRAFAFARGLFLHLVSLRVCAPTECE